MLTPAFKLRQNDEFLTIEIKAPFAKISDAEVYFDGDHFYFSASPYFLKLVLPGHVTENGKERAAYDADVGTFTVEMPKVHPGEIFSGLDLLTKLLTPVGTSREEAPGIEAMGGHEVNCEMEQEPWTEEDEARLTLGARTYGFARLGTGVIARLREEIPDVVDIEDPEHTGVREAREERQRREREKFNDEHYLADLYEPPSALEEIFRAPRKTPSEPVEFTEEEREKMRKLPRREYLLSPKLRRIHLLGLGDILFAYAYDVRFTDGEHCVESGWTVSKLSATLSWFEEFESVEQVVMSCFRRSLCYPLYRSWDLASLVLKDVEHVLKQGPRCVVRCLLRLHDIFACDDSRYVLNKLYIDHYAAWVQHLRPEVLSELADDLHKVQVTKAAVDLELEELEAAARAAIAEADASSDAEGDVRLRPSSPLDSDDDSSSD